MSAALRRLAGFAVDLRPDDVPDRVFDTARTLLLDHIGTVYAGQRVPEAATVVDLVRRRSRGGVATVLGAGFRTSEPDAALANGTAADVLEHQDGYRFGGFHPSHAIPGVLAVAERQDASIGELLTAMVVAYEVANRIGRAAHPAATKAGWFPTAAAYGAAAGCARLLGLDAGRAADALGATAMGAPAVMIESIFAGPGSKPTFAGYIARSGVEGALLAEAGLSGWHGALEDARGLLRLLGADPGALLGEVDTLGSEWTIFEVHQKRYAACRHTHGAAQAAIQISHRDDLDARDVSRVDVETYDVAKLLVDRQVELGAGATACTLSLPYAVAAAVVDRDLTGEQYTSERTSDTEIHRIAGTVTTVVAPDLEARYPEFTATRVTITTRDGARHEALVDVPTGDVRAPMTREQLVDKFTRAGTALIGAEETRRALDAVLDPTPTTPVRHLVSALTGATLAEEPN